MRSISAKLFLSLIVLGGVVFLGGSIVRTSVIYDIYLPGTLVRKPFLSDAQVNYSIRIYALTAFYTMLGYAATLIGAIGATIQYKHIFRKNGGIFMAAVLFYCCMPIEVYLMIFDLKLLRYTNAVPFEALIKGNELQILLGQRLNTYSSSVDFLIALASFSAMLLIVWQPLSKN